MKKVWIPVCLSLIVAYILASACIGNPGNGPLSGTPTITPSTTASGTIVDLTNQNSPQAATFRNGASYTPLITPQPRIRLEKVAGGFSSPMMIAVPPDDSGRLFLADQIGVVKIIGPDNKVSDTPFLDVQDRMVKLNAGYDERGLLSLAFHPEYKNNGRVFVYYSAPLQSGAPDDWSCTNRLSEFRVLPGNPDRVNMSTEKILLSVNKPQSNHNGGPLLFGPDDGYLYLALGDGGGADDNGTGHIPGTGNAQYGATLLGKIIRIDVDKPGEAGKNYAIPPDNPFVGTAGFAPEIFAGGFRNPAYASFDTAGNHSLITASAGQALFESVFIVDKGGNYGWNIREGTHCFNPEDNSKPPAIPCPITGARGEPLIGPVIETGHDVGNTIVGGYIYSGAAMPDLTGNYIFGEWSTAFTRGDGALLVSTPPAGYDISRYPPDVSNITPLDNRMWTTQEFRIANNPEGRINTYVRGFGEDEKHEIYVLTSSKSGPDPTSATGEIWKLVPG
ncbi:MAG: PQQ-dependent sugar dehydrogenase [Methanoregula sp.]|nr:PQQ-dependent sugar dehydrogenase [Methanoregula sp.]